MRKSIENFILCGFTGWCIECAYTGLISLLQGNSKLTSTTSLWMFPIYGMAAFISPIYKGIKKLHVFFRAFIYGILIISVEYIAGTILLLFNSCPWDYTYAAMNYKGIIRLDYFPLWMAAGLFFEFLLFHCDAIKNKLRQ
ncbi:MAG: hypothetical protein ACI39R_00640 [Lachnospiraceae bacterium]